MRLALDTNILVYAERLNIGPGDLSKTAFAVHLVSRIRLGSMVLARQTLAELHRVLVRKGRKTPEEASARVRLWARDAELIDTDAAVFDGALELASNHGFQIFDAIILAAAVEARCDLLLSEDFQDGFAWRGVVVTNPFGPVPDRRLASLLA
ncbi:MAG TPA: PIN domain-containing protein [Caulobacteraceae bacterium]|nr:PIN domain-containing protein [Caulobacteraceae bacterium]